MSERVVELRAILADVRRRWVRRARLRAWTLGAAAAAAMLLVGVFTVWLVANDGVPLVIVVGAVLALAGVSVVSALLPLRQQPTDKQVARLIEERAGGLDDVLVTAIEHGTGEGTVAGMLINDAVRAAHQTDLRAVISSETLRRAGIGAVLGTASLVAALAWFAPPINRASHVVGAYWFPARYAIEVTPGSVKLRAGQPLTIVARVPGTDGGLVSTLTVGTGADARSVRMTPGQSPGEFTITLENVATTFPYAVLAGAARSADYIVDVIRPVRMSRIDLSFEYPKGVGLAPHTEENAGDIYAPAGTKVRVQVTADKPLGRAEITLAGQAPQPMDGTGHVASAELVIAKDGSYRVSLSDLDGLSSEGNTEYFIRMLDDRPPDVRILRPAGDRQVSPLEEVVIEARADDDYGLASLELVLRTSTGHEQVVPLGAPVSGTLVTGGHTLYLEDLRVEPGDFVTYHARARDLGRGRRPAEARSDIFFLEVKPYEEEFVSSDSQAGASSTQETGVEELAAMQKEIIAATWKLDARGRRARDARSAQDIQAVEAVATAQTALQAKAADAADEITRAASPPRRRGRVLQGLTVAGDSPMARAVEAMGRAAGSLNGLDTAAALPHEEEALTHLLKAASAIRRRQVQQQQAQGRGGNGNRQQPDLSTLFDQELRKKQQTNYETPSTTENRNDGEQETDPLADIRDLARRQDALARQQEEIAARRDQLDTEDLKRQLERLSREQNELREQAEQLAKQMESQGLPSGSSSAEGRKMGEISNEMRNAARDLGRQDPQQASARADRALQQLRNLEQQMQGARPDERRRALGDLQMEARQLADAERRLGNEAAQAGAGAAGEDARRRLAGEQERLADRADRLRENVTQLARATTEGEGEFADDPDGRRAMAEASREFDQQRVSEQMRESAAAMRGSPGSNVPESTAQTEAVARSLDRVAERLGAAAGGRDGETTRLSDQLARTQELRDRMGELQRTLGELERAGDSLSAGLGAAGDSQAAVSRLQREVDSQLERAQRLAAELGEQTPGMPAGGSTPEQWQRSTAAPGTEAFKQDFAKWESLKKNLLAALERNETRLSADLRAREQAQRLNAGGHTAVSDTYRDLVDRYYQSLATPRRPRR